MKNNFFVKSHGLGNEYVVFDSEAITFKINDTNIKKLCNVNFGIGSDGLLLKVPITGGVPTEGTVAGGEI